MRRLLVLAVALVMLLTACSASPAPAPQPTTGTTQPTVRIPTFEDCGQVAGMIYHKTSSSYSYFDNEDAVSTQNLLFVPGGTVVSSNKIFAVYTYTENNVLDMDALNATGQTIVSNYMVAMAAGSVTISNDA